MKKISSSLMAAILAIIMVVSLVSPGNVGALEGTSFPDIENHWAKPWIIEFVNKAYIEGYPNGLFNPDGFITRAEVAAILSRLGIPHNYEGKMFSDVENSSWYVNVIEDAVKSGVIDGYTNNTFLPDRNITREEAFKICAYCIGKLDVEEIIISFADNNEISGWAEEYAKTLIQIGLLEGYKDNTLKPKNFITRAEFVKLFQGILETDPDLGANIRSWRGELIVDPSEPTEDPLEPTPETPEVTNPGGGGSSGKQTPQYTVPTGLTAEYGDTLADISLPNGFSWEPTGSTSLEMLGSHDFTVKFTPNDTNKYLVVTGIAVTVTVTPKTLTFTGGNLMLSPINSVNLDDVLSLVGSDTISSSGITITTVNAVGVAVTNGIVTYDGTEVTALDNQINFTITCTGDNYTANNPVSANANIYDGIVKARAIPVMQKNITTFNEYATLDTANLNKFYKLYENIVLEEVNTGESNWTPIGTEGDGNGFEGSFDGNSKNIRGLNIDNYDASYVGLFGHIGPGGVVEKLSLDKVNIIGGIIVGSIAGCNGGTIGDCYYSNGVIIGSHRVGGVAGDNYGAVVNCGSNDDVSSTGDCSGGIVGSNTSDVKDCYSTGNIYAAGQAGGIAGWSNGIVEGCYTIGNISSGTGGSSGGIVGKSQGAIDKCYSTGDISSLGNSSGGIAGASHDRIQRSYSEGNVSGANEVGGIAGYCGWESHVIIQNCYSTGDISGINVDEGDNAKQIGGIVGSLQSGVVKWCYATGNIIGRFDTGGIVGWGDSGAVSHCIALNEYIVSGWGNRISPSDEIWKEFNYAYSGMLLGSSGSEALVSSVYSNSKEGADKTGIECKDIATWEDLYFDFTETWHWSEGHLPYLHSFSSESATLFPNWIID